jgi:hypothetical protein
MKNVFKKAGGFLLGAVVSAIVTNVITGQPLTGLVKLKGLYKTFIQSAVPAWGFALVLLVAVYGLYYFLTHMPKRRGKVHFVPDAHNSGWARQSGSLMEIRIGGTFTYEGDGNLTILQAFLRGTQQVTDMNATVPIPNGSGKTVTVSQIDLQGRIPTWVLVQVRLKPGVGTPGQPLRSKVVLRDIYNRDFLIGPIELPYIGARQTVGPNEK